MTGRLVRRPSVRRSLPPLLVLVALIVTLAVASTAHAELDSDSVREILSRYHIARVAGAERGERGLPLFLGRWTDEALADASPSSMSLDTLDVLIQRLPIQYSSIATSLVGHLDRLATNEDADGAWAAALRVRLLSADSGLSERTSALTTMLTHPSADAALSTGRLDFTLTALHRLPAEGWATLSEPLEIFSGLISEETPASFLHAASRVILLVHIDADGTPIPEVEPLRRAMLHEAKRRQAAGEANEILSRAVAELDSALVRGELIGHPAPRLEFTWWRESDGSIHRGDPAKVLSDLRGKVVVLDFWTTWCIGCVAGFPKLDELRAHYADHPVVLVGVTSLQGTHVDGDGNRTDTSADPALEMDLMAALLSDKRVTWPVGFTSRSVFNPDFGVTGVPSIAIIDARGHTRHARLHPEVDRAQFVSLIDQLLHEAGSIPPQGAIEQAIGTLHHVEP
jgi:thiol-disulfide isomerase/thioredoxin